MATRRQRSKLTFSQQSHVRANMMRTASAIADQLEKYVQTGTLVIAGRTIDLSSERLAAWRMVLDRTIPTLSAAEITHKSGLETMDSDKLVGRLAELVKARPELAQRLQEALGGRLVNAEGPGEAEG